MAIEYVYVSLAGLPIKQINNALAYGTVIV